MNKLLSLCMIARDEEKVIRRCLESVQGLVDEIIVVDTGSVDSTKDIALEFTDKVYDFIWINDFSIAKNEAIRKATGKWILVLDADEYVQPDKHKELRSMLENRDDSAPFAYILPIINITDKAANKWVESTAVRLMQNRNDVFFERPIHEQVVYQHGDIPLANYPLTIFHTGYTEEIVNAKNKTERNLAIFNSMRQNRTFSEYDYFTLGNEYSSIDPKKALYYYKRAITKRSMNQAFIIYCKYRMINTLVTLDQIKEALEEINDCINSWPSYVDFYYLKAKIYDKLGAQQEAISLYKQCLDLAEQNTASNKNFWLVSPNNGSIFPLVDLKNLYFRQHDIQNTVKMLIKILELNNADLIHLYQFINLLTQTDTIPDIINLLDNMYPDQSPENTLRLLQTSLLLGNRDLCEFYYSKFIEVNGSINDEYTLHYAVITDQKDLFNATLQKLCKPYSDQINRILFLGACYWKNHQLASLISENDEKYSVLVQSIFRDDAPTLANETLDISVLVQGLIDLFKTGNYESYDWVIQKLPSYSDIIANLLGDYFYSQNNIQLAIDYYSLLLQRNQLSALGYENVTKLYFNQGEIQEGLEFLKIAITLNPSNISLYYSILSRSNDQDTIAKYSKQFLTVFPQHKGIPLFRSLLVI